MVPRVKCIRNDSRVSQLVKTLSVKADAESINLLIEPGRERNDGARVQPSAEEGADGNVTPQTQANRILEQLKHLFDRFRFGRYFRAIAVVSQVPILLDPDSFSIDGQIMTWQ